MTAHVTYSNAISSMMTGSMSSPNQFPLPRINKPFATRMVFYNELSQCLYDFVIQLLPTPEEMAVKEDVRKLLEKLIRKIVPESRLLSFGSSANGFSLRNSDMDLCCLIDKAQILQASDLVNVLGKLLEEETKFHVKPLPFARIPIVKLTLDPSPGLPSGISCDIGFENRLALENTRLLLSYASVDPTRVRTMVLFIKVWTKRRKINSPYRGTLSSYGYVMLVIYFLVHVKNPPVLPNLQQMPPLRPISPEDMHIGDHNIWFFDDIDLLRDKWQSANTETVAELLVDFFRYYSREFAYSTDVVSIRAGFMNKDDKGWAGEGDGGRYNDPTRERNRLCIEDPFEISYNVARTVTKDGLYTIRGEFMRASRILAARPERAFMALSQLCEEREEDLVPSSAHPFSPTGQRLAPIPPQVPYTVGSSQNGPPLVVAEDGSPGPRRLFEPLPQSVGHERKNSVEVVEVGTPVLQHMAPTRGKWTSPPPPDAPVEDQDLYRNRLGLGLSLATSSTPARELQDSSSSSSTNSDVLTEDDLRSEATDSQPPSPHSGIERRENYLSSSDVGKRGSTMQLKIGKMSSPELSDHESNKLTPRASEYGATSTSRGRGIDRSDSGTPTSFNSTPTKPTKNNVIGANGNQPVNMRPPAPESMRRSSSGPPVMRSAVSVTALDQVASASTSSTYQSENRERGGAELTLETAHISTGTSSSPSPSQGQSPISSSAYPDGSHSMRSPWPQFVPNPFIAPQPQQQQQTPRGNGGRHKHSASTSSTSSASGYPVTIYRTAPQAVATTFPLYQQASPPPPLQFFPSTSSSPHMNSSLTYEPVHFRNLSSNAGSSGRGSPSERTATPNSKSGGVSPTSTAPSSTFGPRKMQDQRSQSPSPPVQQKVTPVPSAPPTSKSNSKISVSNKSSPPSRTSSLARRRYDPSAAFRIPTTIAGPEMEAYQNSPTHYPYHGSMLPPSPPESARSSGASSPPRQSSGANPKRVSRRGTDASTDSTSGSTTSGGQDVPDPTFVWSGVR